MHITASTEQGVFFIYKKPSLIEYIGDKSKLPDGIWCMADFIGDKNRLSQGSNSIIDDLRKVDNSINDRIQVAIDELRHEFNDRMSSLNATV